MKMKDNYNDIYDLCKNHMHAYVLAEMVDGSTIDGIVTGLDEEYVYFAVPLDAMQHTPAPEHRYDDTDRQFGFGFPGYGYGFGYGPRPRFRRLVLPLAALTALSILPWY